MGRTGVHDIGRRRTRKGEVPISRKKTKNPKRPSSRSPESRRVAKELATLALVWLKQDQQLTVRQREDLRRALSRAGENLSWDALSQDPLETAARDVAKLTQSGMRAIAGELDDELAGKRTEMTKLKKAAESVRKLSEEASFEKAVEFSYTHTAREVTNGLVTRTETLMLADADEATSAADLLDKKFDSWGKLRELMIEDLKMKRRRVDTMKDHVSEFVDACRGLVDAVFAVHH